MFNISTVLAGVLLWGLAIIVQAYHPPKDGWNAPFEHHLLGRCTCGYLAKMTRTLKPMRQNKWNQATHSEGANQASKCSKSKIHSNSQHQWSRSEVCNLSSPCLLRSVIQRVDWTAPRIRAPCASLGEVQLATCQDSSVVTSLRCHLENSKLLSV